MNHELLRRGSQRTATLKDHSFRHGSTRSARMGIDRLFLAPVSLLLGYLLLTTGSSVLAADDPTGLHPIFNGTDLTGWDAKEPSPFWRATDGVLIGQSDPAKRGNVLYTRESYLNFDLELEVRWNGEIDSGIMLRKPELQLQFGISRSLKTDMTCSFYTGGKDLYPQSGRAKNLEQHFNQGDWNKVRLKAQGDTFTVWLNGEKVTEYTNPKYSGMGPIGLQIHPGLKMKVEFRNIRLKELN